MKDRPFVIAIDGPAASGKSSTARAVAGRLGVVHLDSGALYRLATLVALREELADSHEITRALDRRTIELVQRGTSAELTVDGESAEPAIRDAAVTAAVSRIAAMPAVRDWVNARLRAAATEWGSVVMDGRDIGTDVFPDAALKVFLTATATERARRRLRQDGRDTDPEAVREEAAALAERDRLDASREVAPLRRAPDARLLDTTDLAFAEQVERIVAWANQGDWGQATGDR